MTSIDGDFFPFSSSERYDFDIPRRSANTFCLTSWKTRIRRSASDNITTNIPLGHGKYLSFDKMESDLAPEHLFQRPQQPQHAIDVGHYEENSPKQTGLTRPSRPFIPVLRSLPPLLGSYGSFGILTSSSMAHPPNCGMRSSSIEDGTRRLNPHCQRPDLSSSGLASLGDL